MSYLKDELILLLRQSKDLSESVNKLCENKKFRVISKYNGQPYGRSRSPLTGKILTVNFATIEDGKIHIFSKEERLALELHEVEFVP